MTKVYMRVGQGCLLPADATQTSTLRHLGLKVGGIIEIDIKQVRSVKFNSLVHKIGDLLVKNCDAFTGIDAHLAIKRLQLSTQANRAGSGWKPCTNISNPVDWVVNRTTG